MYDIKPTMTYEQVIRYYKQYIRETRKRGQKPVSFLKFLTGRL